MQKHFETFLLSCKNVNKSIGHRCLVHVVLCPLGDAVPMLYMEQHSYVSCCPAPLLLSVALSVNEADSWDSQSDLETMV